MCFRIGGIFLDYIQTFCNDLHIVTSAFSFHSYISGVSHMTLYLYSVLNAKYSDAILWILISQLLLCRAPYQHKCKLKAERLKSRVVHGILCKGQGAPFNPLLTCVLLSRVSGLRVDALCSFSARSSHHSKHFVHYLNKLKVFHFSARKANSFKENGHLLF